MPKSAERDWAQVRIGQGRLTENGGGKLVGSGVGAEQDGAQVQIRKER